MSTVAGPIRSAKAPLADSREVHVPSEPASPRLQPWMASLAALLVLVTATALICVFYWPGHMNLDTLDELRQAQAGRYSDWHTPVLSALWRVLLLAGLRSPGWVLAGGVLTLLVGLYLVLRVQLSRPWALLGAALVFAFPPVLGFDVELGTDAWFAAAIICGFGFAARCARTRGVSRFLSASLVVVCAFLAEAARPTAAVPLLVLLGAFALVTVAAGLRGWRRVTGTVAFGAAATALVVGSILGVQRFVLHAAEMHPEQVTYEDDLVALSIREHEMLLPSDVYPRQDIAFLEQYADSTGVIDISPLLFGDHAVIAIPLEGAKLESLRRAWYAAIREHPYGYLQVRLHSALWQLTMEGSPLIVFYGTSTFPAQPPGSGFSPASPRLHSAAVAYTAVGSSSDGMTGGPLQRVWLYVLVLTVAVAVGLRERRSEDLVPVLLSIAMVMYAAEVALVTPGVNYRYMHAVVAAGAVVLVYLSVRAGQWLAKPRRLAVAGSTIQR